MKYEEMKTIMRRLDESVGGRWGIMGDGPLQPQEIPDGRVSPFLAHYRPWKASNEAAPGLTIGTDANTEMIGRLSGYMMNVRANADFIIHAKDDMRLLISEIVRLNAMLLSLGKSVGLETYQRTLRESGDLGNFLVGTEPNELSVHP